MFEKTDRVMTDIINSDESALYDLMWHLAAYLSRNQEQLPILSQRPTFVRNLDVNTDKWTAEDMTTLASLWTEGHRVIALCEDFYMYFLPRCNVTFDLVVACKSILESLRKWEKLLRIMEMKQRLGYTPLWANEAG